MFKTKQKEGPSWPWSYGSWIYNYLCNQCLSPLMSWVRISIRARCTTLCDKVCQWLATGRLFSPVSSTNKTDRHDITEILLKVALNTIKQTDKQTKRKRTNKDLQNITQKTKDRATRTPLTTGVNWCAPEGWGVAAPRVAPVLLLTSHDMLRNGKESLLHVWHLCCCWQVMMCSGRVRSLCSTCGTCVVVDNSWRRKGPDCDYDKRKISSSFLISRKSWYEP